MAQLRRFVGRARVSDLTLPTRARPDRGQGLLEYALIMVFVMLVVFTALILLGPTLATIFDNINSAL